MKNFNPWCMLYVSKYTHINCTFDITLGHGWAEHRGYSGRLGPAFGLPKLGLLGWAAQAGRLLRNFMLIRIINRPSGYELSKINDVGIQFAQFAGLEYYM